MVNLNNFLKEVCIFNLLTHLIVFRCQACLPLRWSFLVVRTFDKVLAVETGIQLLC